MKITRPALFLLAAFALGAGVRGWRGQLPATPASEGKSSPREVASRNESRPVPRGELELKSFWQQRGAAPSEKDAAALALEAARSGRLDDAGIQAAVAALIADPGFINTLWEAFEDEGLRQTWMCRLFTDLADARPVSFLEVIERAAFKPSQVPTLGESLSAAARGAPRETVAFLIRCEPDRIGAENRDDALVRAGIESKEAARAILDDFLTGRAYSDKVVDCACSSADLSGPLLDALNQDPQAAKAIASHNRLINTVERIVSVLGGESNSAGEGLATISEDDLENFLLYGLYLNRSPISAAGFEQIAKSHPGQSVSVMQSMVQTGRLDEALNLLEQNREMPGTKAQLDDLYGTVAESAFEMDPDPARALVLLDRVQDGTIRNKHLHEMLLNMAVTDPEGARAYLPLLTDPEQRAHVEWNIKLSTLAPP